MKKLTFGLFVALAACSTPQSEPVVLEEPMMEPSSVKVYPPPVMVTSEMIPRCPTDEVVASDGIGGTGCR